VVVPLMRVFIFSAMVSGMRRVMLLYMADQAGKQKIDMHCVDTIAM